MYLGYFSMSRLDRNTVLRAGIWLVWVAGLSLGFLADRFYGVALGECLALAPVEAASVFGLATVNVLPLLISACAVLISPYLLYPLCFLRAGQLGLCLRTLCGCYGEGAASMATLLLFSSLAFSPFLLRCWMELMENRGKFLLGCCGIYLGIAVLIAALDYWVITPFLLEIMIF